MYREKHKYYRNFQRVHNNDHMHQRHRPYQSLHDKHQRHRPQLNQLPYCEFATLLVYTPDTEERHLYGYKHALSNNCSGIGDCIA